MSAQEVQLVDPLELPVILDYEFLGDDYTVARKRSFVEAYREHGSIYHAAQASRVSRKTVYNWMEADEQFALAVEESKEDCYDKAETSVYKKALNGDSLLLMFYLKAHRPKFRDKVSIDIQSVQDEIAQRMQQLNLKQLPSAVTEFLPPQAIDTQTPESFNPLHFPPQPDGLQKEVVAQADNNPTLED